jgi:hypothetical protein
MGLNDRRDFISMFKKSIEDLNKLEFTGMINSYSGSIVVFLLNTNIDKNSLQIYKNLGFFL